MERVLVLAGPTGAGKTDIAARLDPARYEIVSCDSRQIYKELSIGTARPGPELMDRIKHHLVALRSPHKKLTAASYARLAHRSIREILKRRRQPVIVGGAGFYLRALMYGVFEHRVDLEVQMKVSALLPAERLARLQELDPGALLSGGGHIHPNDAYRIERALAITLSGHLPFSQHWKEARRRHRSRSTLIYKYEGLFLNPGLAELRIRLRERIRRMLAAGLLAETERVLNQYGNCPALATLGYPDVASHLRGAISRQDLEKKLFQSHYQYARRQIIWFRQEQFLHVHPGQVGSAFASGSFPNFSD